MTAFDRSAATKLVEEFADWPSITRHGHREQIEALLAASASLASAVEYIGELERLIASTPKPDAALRERCDHLLYFCVHCGLRFASLGDAHAPHSAATLAPVSTEPERN